MAYDDPRAVSPEDALTMDEWRRRIMGGKPPLLTEQQGGLDTILAGLQRIPGRIAEDTPKFLAGLQRLYEDPSSIAETPTAQMIKSGVTAPRDVIAGDLDPMSEEGIRRINDMANLANTGSAFASAPEGAIASGMARRGRRGVPLTAEEIRAAAARAEAPPPAVSTRTGVADAADRAEARSAAVQTGEQIDPERYKWALPQFADRYPQAGEFEPKRKGGKGPRKDELYDAKKQSDEERLLMKNRAAIVKDMGENPWEPYFDVKKRADVDPANYPREFDTLEVATAKTERGRAGHRAVANDPEALARLERAYTHGKTLGGAGNWYFVKQLEDEFIRQYGETEGRKQFQQKFAGAMASTTAGMSPTNNLLAAHYGNFPARERHPVP